MGHPPAPAICAPAAGATVAQTTTPDGTAAALGVPLRLTLAFIAGLTVLRLAVLFHTPLELYPDEAQYWLWSRELAFGYFSKPPMIAWLIRATTALGGEAEPWVRLSAPLCHAVAALALQRAGTRLYGGWTGFWAAVVYSLAPGVQLSAGVVSTDAPLLAFLSLGLWAYAGFVTAPAQERLRWAAGIGLSVGLAVLAKYAAFYFVLGLILHALWSREARARWGWRELALTIGLILACLAPNLAWNVSHGFETIAHTAANANLGRAEDAPPASALAFDPRGALGFLGSQFGVFGPISFAVLVGGGAVLAYRRRLEPADKLLLSLTLPPLLIILAVAALSRANANWAGAAYSPASVLVAAWLLRWRANRTLATLVSIKALIGAVFLTAAASSGMADRLGLSNAFKRARGWASSTDAALDRAGEERLKGGLTAIAVDDRFLFNAMAYYGRDRLGHPGDPPLVMWVRQSKAQNQAETSNPLTPALGARVLMVGMVPDFLKEEKADFPAIRDEEFLRIRLDPKRVREMRLFVGLGFKPQPRDPRTGKPVAP